MAGYLSGNLIGISTFNLCDCEYFEDTRMPVETLKLLHWLRADACLTDTWMFSTVGLNFDRVSLRTYLTNVV